MTQIVTTIEENKYEISFLLSGQPAPTIFSFSSKYDVWTFIQITVANGIIRSVPDQPNTWATSGSGRPSDTIEWIFENSPSQNTLTTIHHNSCTPYFQSSLGANFSFSAHRDILQNLISHGKNLPFYPQLQKPLDKSQFEKFYSSNSKLKEYLAVRRQWQLRISEQYRIRSQHNQKVEMLTQKLLNVQWSKKSVSLVYNVVRTMITFAPELSYDDSICDITLFIAELVLDDLEKDDDESQSKLFWVLNAVLFEFGQSQWYTNQEQSKSDLINDIIEIMACLYPAVGFFISYEDYEMFKHCINAVVSMFVHVFKKDLLKKLWNLIFKAGDVNALCTPLLTALLFFEFPELNKSRVPDMNHISKLFNEEYHVEDENDFLAIVAAIEEKLPLFERPSEVIDFSCNLFKPLSFE
ncbi:hypothetical protein GPJ56_007651 [Histomonas meleagridis]|uniref:uncharacterized protein n=1 Tax=Histomonas meleagridis TaxID=135588 RepID=UPI00355ABC3E|nr:hypothetical protein GPJ56_007651 [Histomonas meleagridis]KAH0802192.1 hypothetical protein GO595_005051 [Histomonas meleagridis]